MTLANVTTPLRFPSEASLQRRGGNGSYPCSAVSLWLKSRACRARPLEEGHRTHFDAFAPQCVGRGERVLESTVAHEAAAVKQVVA